MGLEVGFYGVLIAIALVAALVVRGVALSLLCSWQVASFLNAEVVLRLDSVPLDCW